MELLEKFWNCSLNEMKQGYVQEEGYFQCLLCGQIIEEGIIYPDEGVLYEASRYIRVHIDKEHHSVFDYLIQLDKKLTGLSEHQNQLMRLFYQGESDKEIQSTLDIGSASTIRNHRFVLREKERQAKVFLALAELMKDKDKHAPAMVDLHRTARMIDDRYHVTKQEEQELIDTYFPQGPEGPLAAFDIKEKHKLVVLRQIAKRFANGKIYTEKEVNRLLKAAYADYAVLRRYLIEYGYLDRKPDGSEYWLKEPIGKGKGKGKMDRRKELVQQYQEIKVEAGVYQILNKQNGKRFVGSTPNLRTLNGKRFELNAGTNTNASLQKDWNEFGEEAFEFEILETLNKKETEYYSMKDELKKMEDQWLAKLQPYGESGYNSLKREKR